MTRRARPAEQPVEKPTNPAIKRLIDHFYAGFVRCFNPPGLADTWLAATIRERATLPKTHMVLPRIDGGKDSSLVKKMIQAWGEETTARLMDEYFARWRQQDPRVIRTNGDLGGFWLVAPYLLVHPHANARTSANMEAAARASAPPRD